MCFPEVTDTAGLEAVAVASFLHKYMTSHLAMKLVQGLLCNLKADSNNLLKGKYDTLSQLLNPRDPTCA